MKPMIQPQESTKARRPLAAIALTAALASAIAISGCDSSSSSSAANEWSETMQLNQPYQIGANGARLVATSMDAPRVDIDHDLNSDARIVTLRSGSAELHGDFTLL